MYFSAFQFIVLIFDWPFETLKKKNCVRFVIIYVYGSLKCKSFFNKWMIKFLYLYNSYWKTVFSSILLNTVNSCDVYYVKEIILNILIISFWFFVELRKRNTKMKKKDGWRKNRKTIAYECNIYRGKEWVMDECRAGSGERPAGWRS